MNLNFLREDFHSAGLQKISFITSRVNMSPRVLKRLHVPGVSSSCQRNGQTFQSGALLKKKHVSFARLACLYVLVCMSLCFNMRTSKIRIGEGHG